MKSYLKAIILSCAFSLFSFLLFERIASSAWVQRQILSTLTTMIVKNTPLNAPVFSYKKIAWGGIRHPLSLSLSEVKIRDEADQFFLVKTIYASWSLRSLLSLTPVPSWFYFEEGQVESQGVRILSVDATFEAYGDCKRIWLVNLVFIPASVSCLDFLPKTFREVFSDINVPLQIKGGCAFDKENLKEVDLFLIAGKGNFSYASFFPTKLKVNEIELSLKSADAKIIRGNLKGSVEGIPLELATMISSSNSIMSSVMKGGDIRLQLDGKVSDVPIDSLKTLWPVGLAPKPRHWVTTNLSRGKANEATIRVDMDLYLQPNAVFEKMIINTVEGDIYPEGVDVNYLGKLPKVLNTMGHAYYTKKKFIIDAIGIVNGMDLTHGHIVINALDEKDQDIQIDLDLKGGIAKAFEIISAAPLNLTQKLGLNLQQIDGNISNHIELKFPLETDVELDQVEVESTAKISGGKAALLDVLKGEVVNVEKGDFDLKVNKEQLSLNGKAVLNGATSEITWIEYFKKNPPFLRQFILLGEKEIFWGDEEAPFVKGSLPVSLTYQRSLDRRAKLDIKVSFANLLINFPWVSFYKESNVPAELTLNMVEGNQNEMVIKHGQFSGNNFQAKLEGSWGTPNSVVTVSNLKVGDLKGNLKLLQKQKRHKLKGTINELDVFSLINNSIGSDNDDESSNFCADISLKVKELVFSQDYKLANVKFKLQFTHGNLQTIEIVDRAKYINFLMTPAENHIQDFILYSNNASEFLELLAPGSDFSGGTIHMVGKRKLIGKESQIEGELDIRNLIVHEAPLLAKILSLTSVNGIMSLFSGDGLRFDRGSTKVLWKKNDITIKDAFLKGSSLGLTFEGRILEEYMDFTGEVIPFYGLNSALSQIPILGAILSGNSEHAIFSTPFELKGKQSSADIRVRPLTTLAPTGMREIFKKQPPMKTFN